MKESILEVELTNEQFFALSNETRRTILSSIYNEPMCPRSIAAQLSTNIVYIKRHLRILLECGLVIQSVQGNMRIYRSNDGLLSLRNKIKPEENDYAI